MLYVHIVSKARALALLVTAARLISRFSPPPPPAPIDTQRADNVQGSISPELVKAALRDLHDSNALSRSRLTRLELIAQASDLRALLVDVITELAESNRPRDREAGRLLMDRYVKRAGSNEVIRARLHMTRPTFYRRRDEGFALVAQRIDELNQFAILVAI
jgi:hypothetical protein